MTEDRGATLRLGETHLVTQYWGVGTKYFFLLILYNFKAIGGHPPLLRGPCDHKYEFDYEYDLLETFRFDYECEFDYEYDFFETFRFDYEYEFDSSTTT